MNLEVLFEKSWKGQRLLIRCRPWLAEINYICAVHRLIQRWRGAHNYVKWKICLNLSFEKWEISFACDVFLSSLMEIWRRWLGGFFSQLDLKPLLFIMWKWNENNAETIELQTYSWSKQKSLKVHNFITSKCVFLGANR